MATWYKNALKESLLGKVYADKSKVQGVDQNPKNNEAIYRNYLSAFKKGVYNYIREDTDHYTNQIIPRKYFAGGFFLPDRFETTEKVSPSTLNGIVNIRDEAVTAEIDPAQRALVPTDKAMAVNYIEPYQNIKQMYDLLPVNIRSLMANILVRSEVSPDAVANLMDEIKKLYTRMKLNTENYHNDMHHLLVTQGALMLAANAGLIKEKRDLIVTFAAALFHDFQLREVYPSGVGKPGSDAWVNETLGIPGTDKGGQLPDLLGIVKYNGPAINNARYDSKQITKEEKLNIQRAFRLLRNGEDLEQVYYEIEAIIRRTDFPSDVKRANDFYWKSATRIRDEMDNLTVEWADKNIVMTDELLNKTIDHLNSEYAIIFKNFAEEKVLIKNEEERDIQKKWLDRQKGIELNFLEALRKVDANRRLKIYQIANLVELSDQSASVWIGSADVTKGLTLGLKEELPFVSLGTNYPMFYAPNLLVSRGLRRLNYLPLNFKANFINNLAYFAHYSTDYAKGKGNAANAKVPDFIFQNMLKSQSEWEIKDKKNVLKGLGVIEDRDGVIKEKPQLSSVPEMAGAMLQPLVRSASSDRAMTKGGIDLNAANLDLRIKRDGNGVPLPVSQQDLTQLGRISGFVPKIIEIKPVSSLPFFNEVK